MAAAAGTTRTRGWQEISINDVQHEQCLPPWFHLIRVDLIQIVKDLPHNEPQDAQEQESDSDRKQCSSNG